MLLTLSNSRSSRLTERCGYHWLKNSAANITVTSCLTKGLIISLLPCFRSLRLRPMKPIAPMQPVIQNAKLLCVTTKKRSVLLAMNVHSCVLSLHSCSRPINAINTDGLGQHVAPVMSEIRVCQRQCGFETRILHQFRSILLTEGGTYWGHGVSRCPCTVIRFNPVRSRHTRTKIVDRYGFL